jgi:DNA-binding transcriptional regulator YiaG
MRDTEVERDALLRRVRSLQQLPLPEVRIAIRRTAGVSLREMATVLGVSPTALRWWETGDRRPSPSHRVAYLALLAELASASGLDGIVRS